METKLRQLMKHEGINSTRLAEILGIQASGISHIMSGRNKPSYDFLSKLLQHFPQLSADWLLRDKGPMYRDEIKNKAGTARPTPTGVAQISEYTGSVEGSAGFGDTRGPIGSGAAASGGMIGAAGSNYGVDAVAGAGVGSGAGRAANFGSAFGTGFGADTGAGVGSGAGSGGVRTAVGLFGPDNDDIIPLAGGYAGRSDDDRGLGDNRGGVNSDRGGAGGNRPDAERTPIGGAGGNQGGGVGNRGYAAGSVGISDARVRGQTRQAESSQRTQAGGPQTDIQAAPPPSVGMQDERRSAPMPYPPDNFTRSASIERIVVFYKDKTFSEYQPE